MVAHSPGKSKEESETNVPKARKLKSGTWFIQLRLGGESIPVTGNTERECVKQAAYIKSQYLVGKREKPAEPELDSSAPEKLPTLGEAVDAYIARRAGVLSPVTIRNYKIMRKSRFQAFMDTDISSIDWQTMVSREASTCAPKTLKNAWGLISSAVAETSGSRPKVILPQIIQQERPFLEPEQIRPFIEAVKDTSIAIPSLLALSSLRRSELLALTWGNVDLKKKIIHVSGSAVPNDENKLVYRKENKNRSSNRIVPIMIDELYNALKVAKKPDADALVVSVPPNALWSRINAVCEKSGLPKVGVHGLRHSFVSLCYHLGVPEKIVMQIGGWSDFETMRKIYTHIARSDVSKYTRSIESFFSGNTTRPGTN